jgi:hypothetical protein
MPEPTNVRLQIGGINITYHLYETNAPVDYDGFGTHTFYLTGDTRYVLIDEQHVAWQTGRYGSGLHRAQPCDLVNEDYIAERLMKALYSVGAWGESQ